MTEKRGQMCRVHSISLTYTTSPTAFGVRNLHTYGKLPVGQETLVRSARTPLIKLSRLEHVGATQCSSQQQHLCPSTCGWFSQWSGWCRVTDCCVSSAHVLFVQTEPSDCGNKAATTSLQDGDIVRATHSILWWLTKWAFEGICYLTRTSARCSLHTAMYSAEGAAAGRKKRQSVGLLLCDVKVKGKTSFPQDISLSSSWVISIYFQVLL